MFVYCRGTSTPLLGQVSDKLWAKGKYDVGLVRTAEPVVIVPKSDYRPCQKQYPLRQEAILLPSEIAVCKCQAHLNGMDDVLSR